MRFPGARITDLHICPLVGPGPVPHVGGPIVKGCPTVLVGGIPAARIGDTAICAGPTDAIVKGSATVIIGGSNAARIMDTTAHGGLINSGCATVLIGEAGTTGAGSGGGASPVSPAGLTYLGTAFVEASKENAAFIECCPTEA